MRPLLAGLIALMLGTTMLRATPAFADTVITAGPPENGYPTSLTFPVEVTSDQQITDITLQFQLRNRNASGFGKPETFTPGTQVSTSVVIDTNPDTNWLPVGNEFTYHWEVTLADGSMVSGEEQTFLYLPAGFDWQKSGNELMTVYYFGERANTANRFLAAASEVYREVGQDVLGATLEHLPVKVVLFVRTADIAESQPSKGQTFEASGIVTCGYRPGTADDIVIVAASCGDTSSVDTLRHEFGHILNAAAGEHPLVRLPSWLDEGLAVLAQEENDFEGAYQTALRRDRLLRFDRLTSPPSDPNQTLVFYGQSFAMVSYLIAEKGADLMEALLDRTSSGTRFDIAFEETYGFDMIGFEAEFRAANGLPPADGGTSPNQPSQPTATAAAGSDRPANPTATAGPVRRTSTADDDDGIDPIVIGVVGFTLLAALAAVFLFLVTQVLANRRPTPAARPSGDEPHREDHGG